MRSIMSFQKEKKMYKFKSPENEGLNKITKLIELNESTEIYQKAKLCAKGKSSILITGESGTGKESIAHYIHHSSLRAKEPFITVNSSSLDGNILLSELFGHKKGAYTDAINDREGLLKTANKGTLFIDEIGDLDKTTQIKLLRTLDSGEIKALGSDKVEYVDVRIIAATNVNIAEKLYSGEFREDFFHRLRQVSIHLESFREKSEGEKRKSINLIIRTKAKELCMNEITFTESAYTVLFEHRFKGNYRELENIIESIYLNEKQTIEERDVIEIINHYYSASGLDNISFTNSDEPKEPFIPITLDEHMMVAVHKTIDECEGNKSAAARKLDKDIKTVNVWNDKYMNKVNFTNTMGKNTIGIGKKGKGKK